MKLHEDKDAFKKLIDITSDYFNYDRAIIEKDYYVMYVLEEIVKAFPDIVFKGGTSLSKAWHVINRFSEDIDLTLETHPGDSKRRRIKHTIVDLIKNLGFKLNNEDDIQGHRDFNRYLIDYPKQIDYEGIKKEVQVETVYYIPGYPVEKKEVASYIYEYLKEKNLINEIEKYELHKFEVKVQSLERTFIDKVFALCDYKIENDITNHARHIYDLYKLYPIVKINDNFTELLKDVREKRSKHAKCYSAQVGENVNGHLKDIKEQDIYKKDYETNTTQILAYKENVPYEEAITVIDKIIESNLFIEKESIKDMIKDAKEKSEKQVIKNVIKNKDLML